MKKKPEDPVTVLLRIYSQLASGMLTLSTCVAAFQVGDTTKALRQLRRAKARLSEAVGLVQKTHDAYQ